MYVYDLRLNTIDIVQFYFAMQTKQKAVKILYNQQAFVWFDSTQGQGKCMDRQKPYPKDRNPDDATLGLWGVFLSKSNRQKPGS